MRAIILLITLCVAAASADSLRSARIVGGSTTDIDLYPSMAALLYTEDWINFVQSCAGTILNERSILTAAQCFDEDSVTIKWLVRLGSTFASTDGTTFTINNIITHPDYSQLTKTNDIAILQVVGFITYTTTIQPARIGGVLYELPEGEILKAVGWGRTSYLGLSSERIRHVDVAIQNQESCARAYLFTGMTVTSDMMCIGWSGGGRGQCVGDTGAPLYHDNDVVIGIYTFSNACGLGTFPSVNTRVNRYLDFIVANA